MKKLTLVAIVAVAMMALAGCGNKTKPVPFDNGDSAAFANADPTVYGVCTDAAMNTIQLLTDIGDTLTLDISAAQEAGKVFGGMSIGERMIVIPNADRTAAEIVINQATLLGNWVMPNPLDGSDEVGVRFKEGGIAESIDQSTIDYKTWKIVRGQLEIVLVREGGGDVEETNLYEFVKLNADSLVYKDAEDVFSYSRQKPKEQYGRDVILEDASTEEFRL